MLSLKRLVSIIAVVIPIAGAAFAEDAAPALSARDRADVARVETYLNSIHTMRSRFLQTAPDGRQVGGTFRLSRPGRMRIDYDPPIKDFIVADGWFVFFWDSEVGGSTSGPIGSSPADFILREEMKLSGDVTVERVDRFPGALEISIHDTGDSGKGRLTLVFEDNPLNFRKWRVVDSQGGTTNVALLDPEFNIPLDKKYFSFVKPEK